MHVHMHTHTMMAGGQDGGMNVLVSVGGGEGVKRDRWD